VRLWRKGNPPGLLVGVQSSAAPLENGMEVRQESKNRTTPRPSNATSGINLTHVKRHIHPCVPGRIIYNSLDMKTARESTVIDEQVRKMGYIYTVEYSPQKTMKFTIKKEKKKEKALWVKFFSASTWSCRHHQTCLTTGHKESPHRGIWEPPAWKAEI